MVEQSVGIQLKSPHFTPWKQQQIDAHLHRSVRAQAFLILAKPSCTNCHLLVLRPCASLCGGTDSTEASWASCRHAAHEDCGRPCKTDRKSPAYLNGLFCKYCQLCHRILSARNSFDSFIGSMVLGSADPFALATGAVRQSACAAGSRGTRISR